MGRNDFVFGRLTPEQIEKLRMEHAKRASPLGGKKRRLSHAERAALRAKAEARRAARRKALADACKKMAGRRNA